MKALLAIEEAAELSIIILISYIQDIIISYLNSLSHTSLNDIFYRVYLKIERTHLIHENSGELHYFDYNSLGISEVKILPYSPKLNDWAKRFVRSAKSACFDHFIVFTEQYPGNKL